MGWRWDGQRSLGSVLFVGVCMFVGPVPHVSQ